MTYVIVTSGNGAFCGTLANDFDDTVILTDARMVLGFGGRGDLLTLALGPAPGVLLSLGATVKRLAVRRPQLVIVVSDDVVEALRDGPEPDMIYFYLAAASREIDRAEAAIARLEAAGLHCSLNWTVDMRKSMEAGKTDKDLAPDEAEAYARADLDGIRNASLFVLLVPTRPTLGAWVELGFALALEASGRRRVIAIGDPDECPTIFLRLSEIDWFPTVEDFLASL